MSKHYTANQKIEQVKNKLIVAIDVGKRDLHVKYMKPDRTVCNKKAFCFRNSIQGLEELLSRTKEMMEAAGLEECVFAMEPTGHYWLTLLR